MNARMLVRRVALVAPGAVVVLSASCGEPAPKCAAARGSFSATYTLVSGTGDCATLVGDVLNVQTYNPPKSATDQNVDFNKASIGIEPSAISNLISGGAVDPNTADTPYALGNYSTSEPGGDGFCVAPTLSVAHLRVPAVTADPTQCPPVAAAPAVDVQYTFSNVRVYSTVAALGTEFSADLAYTTTDPSGTVCNATYHVRAVYPSVSCGAPAPTMGDDGGSAEAGGDDGGSSAAMTDAGDDASATGDDGGGNACDAGAAAAPAASGPMVPDVSLCSPYPNPAAGMASGSGLNPDYAITCDPNLLLCVLAKEPPSLK